MNMKLIFTTSEVLFPVEVDFCHCFAPQESSPPAPHLQITDHHKEVHKEMWKGKENFALALLLKFILVNLRLFSLPGTNLTGSTSLAL